MLTECKMKSWDTPYNVVILTSCSWLQMLTCKFDMEKLLAFGVYHKWIPLSMDTLTITWIDILFGFLGIQNITVGKTNGNQKIIR